MTSQSEDRPDFFEELLGRYTGVLVSAVHIDRFAGALLAHIRLGLLDVDPELYLLDDLAAVYRKHGTGESGTDNLITADSPLAIAMAGEPGTLFLGDGSRWPPKQRPFNPELAAYGQDIIAPITGREQLLGWFSLKKTGERDGFETAELRYLTSLAGLSLIALERIYLLSRSEAQVAKAGKAKAEFVSMVSHELKTPLTSIQGYTDLMLRGFTGEMSEQQQQFLEYITVNIKRMGTLIQNLTDISRIESNDLSFSLVPMSMARIISDTLMTTQALRQEKQIQVHVDLPDNLPMIMGDKSRLIQVMNHLVNNALKYSPPETDVYLAVRTDVQLVQNDKNDDVRQPVVVCTIKDSGDGISETDQAKIFTKFFRGENNEGRQPAGTGLGLAIARGIVELHGGQIWFESGLGEGTAFHFSIPQVPGQAR